jgi:hypothetical protein
MSKLTLLPSIMEISVPQEEVSTKKRSYQEIEKSIPNVVNKKGRLIEVDTEISFEPDHEDGYTEEEFQAELAKRIEDARDADHWLKSKIATKPKVRMNLECINEEASKIENHLPLFHEMLDSWQALSDVYKKGSLKDRMSFELELVSQMNEWIGIVYVGVQDPQIVMRHPDKRLYMFYNKSTRAFKELCKNHIVSTYDQKEFQQFIDYPSDNDTGKGNLSSKFKMTKNKQGMYKTVPSIHLIQKSIAEVWLDHPCRAVYTEVVFNPRPSWFKKAARPDELNTWTGFAIKRDDVLKYTDWSSIKLFMNHLRWNWCSNETEFKYTLGHFAAVFQVSTFSLFFYTDIKRNLGGNKRCAC